MYIPPISKKVHIQSISWKIGRDPLFFYIIIYFDLGNSRSILLLYHLFTPNLLSNNIVTQPYHHIEIIFDYILFWFLSQDLAKSFDIYPHLWIQHENDCWLFFWVQNPTYLYLLLQSYPMFCRLLDFQLFSFYKYLK